MPEDEPHLVRAVLKPLTWGVECPVCEEVAEIELDEDDDLPPEQKFTLCECGALIEIIEQEE